MVSRGQELAVTMTADTSGLVKGTEEAAKALENLKGDLDKVDATDLTIDPKIELSRINRDMANLNRVLDGIERRKADPDVGLDTTQLLKEERRVRSELDRLAGKKVEVEASLNVQTSGFTKLSAAVDTLDSRFGTMVPGLGRAATGLRGLSAAGGEAGAALSGGAAVAGGVGLALGANVAAYKLGGMAANAETARLQLSALTGSTEKGAQAFADLQEFAKDTPFTLDEVAASARYLIASGTDVKDIPEALTDLGNVAAATGADLAGVALVFQQMYNKGKVSNEELLQLAERGVPAYQALADALGVTTAEVQTLATQGKLGRDEIDLLRSSLGDLYPTAMSDQAETFNGQLSTLKDTTTQLGQTLGELVLPEFTALIKVLNEGAAALLWVGDKVGWLDDKMRDLSSAATGGFWEISLANVVMPWTNVTDAINSLGGEADSTGTLVDRLAIATDAATAQTDLIAKSTQTAADNLTAYTDALNGTVDALGELGDANRARVEFKIDRAAALAEITAATTGENAIQLPATLDVTKFDADQRDLVTRLQSFVQAGLEEGARRAKIDPTFDYASWYSKLRADARRLLIRAGVDTTDVDRALNRWLGLPRKATVTAIADYEDAKRQLDLVAGNRASVIEATPRGFGSIESDLDRLARDRNVNLWVTTRKASGSGYGPSEDFTPRTTPTTTDRRPLAPRSSTVTVLLDGEELASKTATRVAGRLAVASTRRLP